MFTSACQTKIRIWVKLEVEKSEVNEFLCFLFCALTERFFCLFESLQSPKASTDDTGTIDCYQMNLFYFLIKIDRSWDLFWSLKILSFMTLRDRSLLGLIRDLSLQSFRLLEDLFNWGFLTSERRILVLFFFSWNDFLFKWLLEFRLFHFVIYSCDKIIFPPQQKRSYCWKVKRKWRNADFLSKFPFSVL